MSGFGLLVTAGCGKDAKPGAEGPAGNRGAATMAGDPGMGGGVAPDPAKGPTVAFVGFGQTPDAKKRLVRFSLSNRFAKPLRSARVELTWLGEKGERLGKFPLSISRPRAQAIAPGVTVQESFEILGLDQGTAADVAKVTIVLTEAGFADGTTWKRQAPPQ